MYSYFKIYFYMSNFASIGRFDLVIKAGTVNKSTVQSVNAPLSFSFKLDLYSIWLKKKPIRYLIVVYSLNFSVAAGQPHESSK